MGTTKIEWCEKSWNPITGCTPISESCAHCYARRMAQRLKGRAGYPDDDPFRVTFHPDRLEQPLKWKKPSRIFVCSMGDLFHDDVERTWINQIMDIINKCPQHTFILLTKRPENMKAYFHGGRPPRNTWLGVTAENQQRAAERVPILLQIPAAVHFVSAEPLLGPIDFNDDAPIYSIDWIIVGAETGPRARPMNIDWARDIRNRCYDAGTKFFFKKLSGKQPIPPDLNVREWPEVKQ